MNYLFVGNIVNIDHSGNRVAAMTYGPERMRVIIVDEEAGF